MPLRRAVALMLVMVLVSTNSLAREEWEGSLSDNFFNAFIEIYKKDPSALGRYPGGLWNISSAQLHEAIMALDTTHFTYMYPMSVRGYEFPDIDNVPLNRLSVMAVKGDKLIAIPFQIDEYDRSGLIWMGQHNKAKPEGRGPSNTRWSCFWKVETRRGDMAAAVLPRNQVRMTRN